MASNSTDSGPLCRSSSKYSGAATPSTSSLCKQKRSRALAFSAVTCRPRRSRTNVASSSTTDRRTSGMHHILRDDDEHDLVPDPGYAGALVAGERAGMLDAHRRDLDDPVHVVHG